MRAIAIALALCAASFVLPARAAPDAPARAVGIENQYADVMAEIGDRFVDVRAIVSDPNVDPHSFETSPSVARALADADLVVVNGLGYDAWAEKALNASPRASRRVVDVQKLLGLPDDASNPHLWYDPRTMPVVARAIADALAALRPEQAAYFHDNAAAFDAELSEWTAAVADFKAKFGGAPVATTEPVADYLLQAMGLTVATPFSLEKAIMDGTDPAPQDIAIENDLLTHKRVRAFVYNRQVTDPLTQSFLDAAQAAGVPVVAVYETMPTPGFHYVSWMRAETEALRRAVSANVSTETLVGKP